MDISSKSILNINSQAVLPDYDAVQHAGSMVFRTGMMMEVSVAGVAQFDISSYQECGATAPQFDIQRMSGDFGTFLASNNFDRAAADTEFLNILNSEQVDNSPQKEEIRKALLEKMKNLPDKRQDDYIASKATQLKDQKSLEGAVNDLLVDNPTGEDLAKASAMLSPSERADLNKKLFEGKLDDEPVIQMASKLGSNGKPEYFPVEMKASSAIALKGADIGASGVGVPSQVIQLSQNDPKLQEAILKVESATVDAKLTQKENELTELTKENGTLAKAKGDVASVDKSVAEKQRVLSEKQGAFAKLENEKSEIYKKAEEDARTALKSAKAQDVKNKIDSFNNRAGNADDSGIIKGDLAGIGKIENEADREATLQQYLKGISTTKHPATAGTVSDALRGSWADGVSVGKKGEIGGLSQGFIDSKLTDSQKERLPVLSQELITAQKEVNVAKADLVTASRQLDNAKATLKEKEKLLDALPKQIANLKSRKEELSAIQSTGGTINQEAYTKYFVSTRQISVDKDGKYNTRPDSRAAFKGVPGMPAGIDPESIDWHSMSADDAAAARRSEENMIHALKLDYLEGGKVQPDNSKYSDDDIKKLAETRAKIILDSKEATLSKSNMDKMEQFLDNERLSPRQRHLFLTTLLDDNTTWSANLADKVYDDKHGERKVLANFLERQGYKLDGVEGGVFSRERVNFHKEYGVGGNTPAFGAQVQMTPAQAQAQSAAQKTQMWVGLVDAINKSAAGVANTAIQLGNRRSAPAYSSNYQPGSLADIIAQRRAQQAERKQEIFNRYA